MHNINKISAYNEIACSCQNIPKITMIQYTCRLMICILYCASGFSVLASDMKSISDRDSLKHQEQRKIVREEWRKDVEHSHDRFYISGNLFFANLNTTLKFQSQKSIISVVLGLEENLKLPSQSKFFVGSFYGRLTPRSGLVAQYYGIERNHTSITDQDYIFLEDTIPQGTEVRTYFNTQVFSFGYLLSVLSDKNTFFGIYFNVYTMMLYTGIESSLGNIETYFKATLPLPNLGLYTMLKFKPWLYLRGSVGYFALQIDDFGGYLSDFYLGLVFRPVKWLSIDTSYQTFTVNLDFPRDITTNVNYNFRGPAIGITFSF